MFGPNISKTAEDTDTVTVEHLQQMAPGHMPDDVTWPWNVKVVIQIYLDAYISKIVRDRGSVPETLSKGPLIRNGMWRIEYGSSHVMDDVIWMTSIDAISLTCLGPIGYCRWMTLDRLYVYTNIIL